ncbi:MAG: hypothetical protein Q9169_000765 [Polycauliona sp. 2 TL-2023]
MDLRSIISERFDLVGPQLHTLWKETLTTGYVLKQAFSKATPPRPSKSPNHATKDEEAQQDYPPHPQDATITRATAEMTQRKASTRVDKATQTVGDAVSLALTLAVNGTTTTVSTRQGEQAQSAQDSQSSSSVRSDDTPPSYANEATQIDKPSPQTDHTSEFTGSQRGAGLGMDPDCDQVLLSRPASLMEGEPHDDNGQPAIFDGPAQVIVAKHDNQECLAVLVTKEMVEFMNNIMEDTSKLERLRTKFAKVDQRVQFTRINVEYCEKLLGKAESDAEIAELREDIERRLSTMPEDEKCHKALERRIGQASESQAEHETYTSCSEDVSVISIDELAKRAAKEEVETKYELFLEAQRNFDAREEQYTHQKQLLQEKLHEHPDLPMAQERLDLCFIEHEREVTRDLAVAEEEWEEARARARKFGPNEWDQESDFATDKSDGYHLSWENDGIASTPTDFIYGWMEDIPDVECPLDISELASGAGQEFGQENKEDMEMCDIRSARLSSAWSSHDCSRNPMSEAYERERQNNSRLDELSSKISALRGVTIDIYDNARNQDVLDSSNEVFSSMSTSIKGSAGRLGRMAQSGNKVAILKLAGGIVGVVVVFWWLLGFFWKKGPEPTAS